MNHQHKSIVWHLIKVAALWFVLAQAAMIAANTYGVPSEAFLYLAVAAFSGHSLLVICETTSARDSSGKLISGALIWLLVGGVIVLSLRITQADDFAAIRKRFSGIAEGISVWIVGADLAFRNMKTLDHLSAASRLIFDDGTQRSLTQAQLHLRTIPASSKEYESAQNLLSITEARMKELDSADGIVAKGKPIEVTKRDQTESKLRITLRNNGFNPVRRIHYKVAYFQIPSGMRIGPDKAGIITKTIRPQDSLTLEVSAAIPKIPVYASINILSWETFDPSFESSAVREPTEKRPLVVER